MTKPGDADASETAKLTEAESSPVSLDFQHAAAPPDMSVSQNTLTSVSSDVPEQSGIAALYVRGREALGHIFKGCKPWSEFLDRSAFSKPAHLGEVSARIQKNVAYYRTNYLVFFLFTMAVAFLTNPRTLLWTSMLLAGWTYLFIVRPGPLAIAGKEYSDRDKLIGMSVISFIVIFFVTNIGATVLYGACLSAALVGAHGAFREPDDLFLDDPAAGSSNLFGTAHSNIFTTVQVPVTTGPAAV